METVWSMQKFRDKSTIDVFIKNLENDDRNVRQYAHTVLMGLTDQFFGFNPYAGKSRRASSSKKWKEWWNKNKDTFKLKEGKKGKE